MVPDRAADGNKASNELINKVFDVVGLIISGHGAFKTASEAIRFLKGRGITDGAALLSYVSKNLNDEEKKEIDEYLKEMGKGVVESLKDPAKKFREDRRERKSSD